MGIRALLIAMIVVGSAFEAEAQVLLERDIQPIVTATTAINGAVEAASPTETTSEEKVASSGESPAVVTDAATTAAPAATTVVAKTVPAQKGPRFICRGTQPFWSLRIESTRMDLDLVDANANSGGAGSISFSAPTTTPSQNSGAAVMNFSGQSKDSATLNALVVNAKLTGGSSCSDGMSDQEYEYSAFVNHGGKILDGCCWIERD